MNFNITLVRKIEYHRQQAAIAVRESDIWYRHYALAAESVREWRQSNTLTAVPV